MGAPQKFRQRYLSIEFKRKLSRSDVEGIVSDISRELKLSHRPRIILHDREHNLSLIMCKNLQLERVRKKIENSEREKIQVKGVSGTIRKAKQKFLYPKFPS